ncbi:Alpha-amylase precursor [Adhaeretor mobilis]|uniref:Alpha-amylase n=2 Tax=Adhaeretor mobilis TaxID=1930276 RepID=A0A517N0Z3_9BACT|nr:Alpha-amylase precursor [Adhaeretor mobilis]
MLQIFEARWETVENRMADIFDIGYGRLWIPPTSRADSGDQSVGYDVYDRFDLGTGRRPTAYGSKVSLQRMIEDAHDASVDVYADLILNHAGFSDLSNFDNYGTPNDPSDDVTFAEAGGYPGLAITLPGDIDGDFHSSFETGDLNGRLAGLVDIAQEKNHQFIRNPVAVGDPNNIPAGTAAAFGRIANLPDANNARFYPDQDLGGTQFDVDPGPGEFLVTRYDFNRVNPLAGDAVVETAEQLLMRHAQWMIQEVGLDGFRLDAVKHMPTNTLTLLDQAVYKVNDRLQHDGSYKPVFSFGEVLDGNTGTLQNYINSNLPNPSAIPADNFEVRGNRDVLDFPLFFAMRSNLTSNGLGNNWHNIRNASQDLNDDGLHNGSQGVSFVDSHDNLGGGFPFLKNVAYAYTLMRPGNALVYTNAKEFGSGRDFPNTGKVDALGGVFGETITKLVEIRNTHGRGDFRERWLDDGFNPDGFSNVYIYERSNSAIVGLNSRNDDFVETRNGVQTDFAPGTVLVELTGNAADSTVDPGGAIPDTLRVNDNGGGIGVIDMSIPSNGSHGRGYVIYGLATPQGSLSLSNVSSTMQGATPTVATNGTARLADIDVITSDTFELQLNTTAVTLPAPPGEATPYRDFDADGDNALFKFDEGQDLNGNSGIDHTTPGSVVYGFEFFTDTRIPGYIDDGSGGNSGSGSGTYTQTIDATQLAEGRHYVTTRAFRHRDDGPAVFTDFKKTIYIDRLPADSAVVSFQPYESNPAAVEDRDLIVRNPDGTANNMHIFLDKAAALSDAQILALAQGSSNNGQAGQYDRDAWVSGFENVPFGNHVATVVTYEATGNVGIQRHVGLFVDAGIGAGFGDLDADGVYENSDLSGTTNGSFEAVLYSQDTQFNPAADVDGDGRVTNLDLFLLGDELIEGGAGFLTQQAFDGVLVRRGDVNNSGTTDGNDVAELHAGFGGTAWIDDLNADGSVDIDDVATLVDDLVGTSRGDFDLDRDVDGGDFLAWQLGIGGNRFDQGDANLDGVVDATDLGIWQAEYGFIAAGFGSAIAASSAIPEPSSLVLVSLGLLVVCSSRKKSVRHNQFMQ